eukprot:8134264-Alexandrium_andersonii.AAC.1
MPAKLPTANAVTCTDSCSGKLVITRQSQPHTSTTTSNPANPVPPMCDAAQEPPERAGECKSPGALGKYLSLIHI